MRQAFRHRTAGDALRVVNVSSGAATHPYGGWAAYCSTKAAVNSLTEVAATEQAMHPDTSVVSVAPGIIETAMQRTIRATAPDRFPDQPKFVEFQRKGALLNAVDAAVLLDWLARFAPMDWSGRFVDSFDPQVKRAVGQHRDTVAQAMVSANRWFGLLEQAE
jgi:benzil reductase ((S)-benzoin forming)